jgi:glycosyltransferase involved in cell wall biosynthesis
MTLRVLHLVRSLEVGGLEQVVVTLTRGLAAHGFTSHLGCLFHPGALAERAEVQGTWVGDRGRKRWHTVLRGLCAYVRRERIGLIHSHNSHAHKYGAAASLLTGVPLVHTKHGRNWPDNPRWVWFSRQLSRATRVVVPVSDDIRRIVVDIEKVPAVKVTRILNGVDMEAFQAPGDEAARAELRRSLGLPEAALVVGTVGRFSPEKQYPMLVRAFAAARRDLPSACLALVGDGRERAAIEAAVQECGVQSACRLPGMRDDVPSWLRCMDLFCLSSDQEGTSITLLEAGACAVPAIVTAVGGNPEIVEHGVTGLVVPSLDEGALVEALCRLGRDEGVRRRMGAAARERVGRLYSAESMVAQYAEVYRRALARRSACD